MRILHVLGKLDRGGAETWLVQVLRHIDRSKYQFDFLVHNDGPGAYDDEVRALGSRVIPCLSPANPVKYARNFLRILKQYGPYDCVHSHVHHFSGYVMALAKLGGVPCRIAHSHCDTRVTESNIGINRKLYLAGSHRLLFACATSGLAVSEQAACSLFGNQWTKDGRWKIAHLGIDLEPFMQPVDRNNVRVELGIPDDAFVVGHVGRFFPQKNHKFLVEIAKHVCAANPRTIFLLVGDGPLRPAIDEQVCACSLKGNFIFAGVRSDVAALMKGAMDVFLFPSAFEGLGLVVVEAQASGLRCFISDVVPKEADIVPALVERLSLAEGPEVWAGRLLDGAMMPYPNVNGRLIQRFSIEGSAADLSCQYEEIAKSLAGGAIHRQRSETSLG